MEVLQANLGLRGGVGGKRLGGDTFEQLREGVTPVDDIKHSKYPDNEFYTYTTYQDGQELNGHFTLFQITGNQPNSVLSEDKKFITINHVEDSHGTLPQKKKVFHS